MNSLFLATSGTYCVQISILWRRHNTIIVNCIFTISYLLCKSNLTSYHRNGGKLVIITFSQHYGHISHISMSERGWVGREGVGFLALHLTVCVPFTGCISDIGWHTRPKLCILLVPCYLCNMAWQCSRAAGSVQSGRVILIEAHNSQIG